MCLLVLLVLLVELEPKNDAKVEGWVDVYDVLQNLHFDDPIQGSFQPSSPVPELKMSNLTPPQSNNNTPLRPSETHPEQGASPTTLKSKLAASSLGNNPESDDENMGVERIPGQTQGLEMGQVDDAERDADGSEVSSSDEMGSEDDDEVEGRIPGEPVDGEFAGSKEQEKQTWDPEEGLVVSWLSMPCWTRYSGLPVRYTVPQ